MSFKVNGFNIEAGFIAAKTHEVNLPGVIFIGGAPRSAGPNTPLLGKFTSVMTSVLAQMNINSFVYQNIGVGKSDGVVADNTLLMREKVAQASCEHFLDVSGTDPARLGIVATSMGAHTASKLVVHIPTKALVLGIPAAYGQLAEDKHFGDDFTTALRLPNSWKDSLAFKALSCYDGDILIVLAEHDKVIPAGVIDEYSQIARDRVGDTNVIPEVEHTFLVDDDQKSAQGRKKLTNLLTKFFTAHL